MSFRELLRELKSLHLPPDQYAVFGSGPLAIRDLRESEDIDILVKESLWKKLATGKEVDVLKIGNIEIFHEWPGIIPDVDEYIDGAEPLDGVQFVNLQHTMEWKRRRGKEKDIRDIALVENHLNTYK